MFIVLLEPNYDLPYETQARSRVSQRSATRPRLPPRSHIRFHPSLTIRFPLPHRSSIIILISSERFLNSTMGAALVPTFLATAF